jgi:hypothetical protein
VYDENVARLVKKLRVKMKIRYQENDATKIPVFIAGKCIEIKNWLRGESFTPFIKEVFRKKECVGCSETENLEKCNGTMCRKCWLKETRDEE